MRSLESKEIQQISGGKKDHMTVNITLDVPSADAAVFTDLYAKVSSGAMGLTDFGQALVNANLTDVVFTSFRISGLHFSQNAAPATTTN